MPEQRLEAQIRQCLHELREKEKPKSNATNMYSSEKRGRIFGIACSNTPPLFQFQECVFNKMTQFIEIFVIKSLLFSILLGGYHNNHSMRFCIFHDFICIISSVGKQIFCRYIFYQSNSFFAICSGTFCNKYSDRHTNRIHGKVNLRIEPPFVRLIS